MSLDTEVVVDRKTKTHKAQLKAEIKTDKNPFIQWMSWNQLRGVLPSDLIGLARYIRSKTRVLLITEAALFDPG